MDAVRSFPASGETDLRVLLSTLNPWLHDVPREFVHVPTGQHANLSEEPLMMFREREGTTFIVAATYLAAGSANDRQLWAQITLDVQSSLSAVGMLAAVSTVLAARGIACNPVSAFLHDHLFVPWQRRNDALDALAHLHP